MSNTLPWGITCNMEESKQEDDRKNKNNSNQMPSDELYQCTEQHKTVHLSENVLPKHY